MEQTAITEKIVSEPSTVPLFLSAVMFMSSIILIIIGFFDFARPDSFIGTLMFAIIIMLFVFLGFILVDFYAKCKMEADSEFIRCFGMSGKIKEIKWRDITKIEIQKFYGTVRVSDNSKSILLSGLFNRHYDILQLLADNLDPKYHSESMKKILKLIEKNQN
jgi:hypothetical protein